VDFELAQPWNGSDVTEWDGIMEKKGARLRRDCVEAGCEEKAAISHVPQPHLLVTELLLRKF
jgi:hypothetical protein